MAANSGDVPGVTAAMAVTTVADEAGSSSTGSTPPPQTPPQPSASQPGVLKNTTRNSVAVMTHNIPHRLVKIGLRTPSTCALCKKFAWSWTEEGMQCEDCGKVFHMDCSANVPADCGLTTEMLAGAISTSNPNIARLQSPLPVGMSSPSMLPSPSTSSLTSTSGGSISRGTAGNIIKFFAGDSRLPPEVRMNGHIFELYDFLSPVFCVICSDMLWGIKKQGYKCMRCHCNVHIRCIGNVNGNCVAAARIIGSGSVIEPVRISEVDSSETAKLRRGPSIGMQPKFNKENENKFSLTGEGGAFSNVLRASLMVVPQVLTSTTPAATPTTTSASPTPDAAAEKEAEHDDEKEGGSPLQSRTVITEAEIPQPERIEKDDDDDKSAAAEHEPQDVQFADAASLERKATMGERLFNTLSRKVVGRKDKQKDGALGATTDAGPSPGADDAGASSSSASLAVPKHPQARRTSMTPHISHIDGSISLAASGSFPGSPSVAATGGTATSPATSTLPEGRKFQVTFESFKIYWNKQLGHGHYGVVYKAKFIPMGTPVAVKVIDLKKPQFRGRQLLRLREEIAIMQKITHPNVIKLIAYFEHDKKLHMFMEFADRGDLLTHVMKKKKLPEDEARFLFQQLCIGLNYLHCENIVHRDLKPDNLLLCAERGVLRLKIADFGFAKFSKPTEFLISDVGTLAYRAPEVIKEQDARALNLGYDSKVDCWSIGVILYACLGGVFPFHDRTPVKTQIEEGEFVFPDEYFGSVSDDVWALPRDAAIDLVCRLLVVDPVSRLSVAEALTHRWFQKESLDLSGLS